MADARLLVPALVAWGATASCLALAPAEVGLLAAVALGVSLLGLRGTAARRPAPRSTVGASESAVASALALTGAATCLCLTALAGHGAVRASGLLARLVDQGATATVQGSIASDPRVLPPDGRRRTPVVVVEVAVDSVSGRGRTGPAHARVTVFGGQAWARRSWGERVRAVGRLAPARPGERSLATFDAPRSPQVLARAGPLWRATAHLRAGLRAATSGLPPDAAGLLPGLVVGDTSALPADLEESMRRVGMTHLVAVSGSNVSVIGASAFLAARAARLPRWARPWLAVVVVAAFVVLARPEPSVLRAAVMGGIGLVGLAGARRAGGIGLLSSAVVALLVVDPWLARSYGFALSTLATLGLLLWASPWGAALGVRLARLVAGRRTPGARLERAARVAGTAVAVPLAAQAACGPVVVLLSASISPASVPANLAAGPLVAPATVLGVGTALLAAGWPRGAALLAHVAGWPAGGIAAVARVADRAPGASLPWPGGWPGAAALALLTGVALVASRRRTRLVLLTAVLAVVLVAAPGGAQTLLGWWRSVPGVGSGGAVPAGWRFVACDVGQGDALVLATVPGHAVLVDAGPDPAAVDRCLHRLRVRVLDAVVLTHDHADHVDGLPGALRHRRVSRLVVSPVDEPADGARRVRGWAAGAGVPIERARVGEHLVWGPVRAEVLWPARRIDEGSVPNNASVVLLVDTGQARLLLLGDVEPPAARAVELLLAERGVSSVDVLKVAHHGSALQDPELVTGVHPRLAVISVGVGNDYGHPAASTLSLLASTGARVARTDRDGDVVVVERGGGLGVVTGRR